MGLSYRHTNNTDDDKASFELGGGALASTPPSENMASNFIALLEDSLGQGAWVDPVASQLARPLNAILAFLPPEGARVRLFVFLCVAPCCAVCFSMKKSLLLCALSLQKDFP